MDALSDVADCTCMDWGKLDSIAGMAESVLRAAPPRFALAGHSMGGRVAFQVDRMAPERVERIALLNTGAATRPPGEAGEIEERKRRALLKIAQTEGMHAGARAWLPPMIDSRRLNDAVLVERIVEMVARKTPEIWEKQMLALLGRPDARPVVDLIRCPALLLSGREDVWSPPARHAEMAEKIPGSKLAIIADSGHMSTMERPEAVAAAMREWLTAPR